MKCTAFPRWWCVIGPARLSCGLVASGLVEDKDEGAPWDCAGPLRGQRRPGSAHTPRSPTLEQTTETGGGCSNAGVGTSYACPVASGAIALMLEVRALGGSHGPTGIRPREGDPTNRPMTGKPRPRLARRTAHSGHDLCTNRFIEPNMG